MLDPGCTQSTCKATAWGAEQLPCVLTLNPWLLAGLGSKQHPMILCPLGAATCHQAGSPRFIPHSSGCPGLPKASKRELSSEDCLTTQFSLSPGRIHSCSLCPPNSVVMRNPYVRDEGAEWQARGTCRLFQGRPVSQAAQLGDSYGH